MTDEADRAVVGRLRALAAGSVLLPALVLALRFAAAPTAPSISGPLASWTAPLALIGLVSPVIGFRLFAWRRESALPGLAAEARRSGYRRALLLALGSTAGIALPGLAAHLLTGAVGPLAGLAGHTLLVGALWPTPEGLLAFGAES